MPANRQINGALEVRTGLQSHLFLLSALASMLFHVFIFLIIGRTPIDPVHAMDHHNDHDITSIHIVLNEVRTVPEELDAKPEDMNSVLAVKDAPTEPVIAEIIEPEEIVEPKPEEVPPLVEAANVSVTTDAQDLAVDAYWSRVCRSIAQNIKYPRRAKVNRWSGLVVVHLHVDASGVITGAIVEEETVRPQLASAIRRAITKASPVEPPPRVMGDSAEASLPIRFSL